jgi:hypothetical protein
VVAAQLSRRLLTASRSAGVAHEVDAAASPPAVEHAARVLTQVGAECGVGTDRLDSRHGWGMSVTLPIGVATPARR